METPEQLARMAILRLLSSQGVMTIDLIDRYCFLGYADRMRLAALIRIMREEYLVTQVGVTGRWQITDAGEMYLERGG